jgi:hypothetical protein
MADLLPLWSLIAIDVVVYAALVAGFLAARKVPVNKSLSLAAAFGILEGSLTQSFPDLPSGFTWHEGLAKARKLRLDVNWGRVDDELHTYEAFRYGGSEAPGSGGFEVTRLAALLRRGRLGF